MGLDQYLKVRRKLNAEEKKEFKALLDNHAEGKISDDECEKEIDKLNINEREIHYWRKANHVRQWLVENASYPSDGNCIEHILSEEILEKFLSDAVNVLTNPNDAENKIPTSSGFFFGSTDYDDYYFTNIQELVNLLTDVLETVNFEKEEVVYEEWW